MSHDTTSLSWAIGDPSVVRVGGKDCFDFIHRMSSGDVRALTRPGMLTQTLFVNEQGRLLDWCTALRHDDQLLLCASPGRPAALQAWLERFVIMDDVEIAQSDSRILQVFGPQAPAALDLTDWPPAGAWVQASCGICFVGPPALGDHLVVVAGAADAAQLVERLTARAGAALSTLHLELLRLRAGMPGADHEFASPCNPFEIRLGRHAIAWNKGCYIGQEVLSRLDSYDKVARLMMGFECNASFAATPQSRVVDQSGAVVGKITSCAQDAGTIVGLCIVKRAAAQPSEVVLQDETMRVAARLVDRPFF